MNSKLKTTLLVLFALTAAATGILAWQQNRALQTLRDTQNATADKDRTALEKRLADAERRAHDLQNELAALKSQGEGIAEASAEETPVAANNGDGRDRRNRFRGPGGGPEAFTVMMNDPKVVQLMNSGEKLMLDSRYAALFKSLTQGGVANLTPEQLDTFKNLLVEKQNTMRDVMMTARSQGVTDRAEISQLTKNAQAELDTQIQSTLGATGYEQYQQYEKTLPQRTLVNQLSQSLSYTSAPLSDTQTQQLVQILADSSTSGNTGQRRNTGGVAGPMGGGFGGGRAGGLVGGAPITDAAVTQAQSVLTPAQLTALTALQQQQKAQQEMFQAMRVARDSANAAPQTSAPAATNASRPAK